MTAVQNFTGLAELRTTSVEEKRVLCVRVDIMHDAFDEIPFRLNVVRAQCRMSFSDAS